jgi:ABC-type polysaccharide/polyol phosphate export permease
MRDLALIPAEPPPEIRHRPDRRVWGSFQRVWAARGFVRSLAERDIRARYKQAVLGSAWAFVQPLSLVLVFTLLSRTVTKVDTRGVPYVLFSYTALLPWQFFSSALTQGGLSLINNSALLGKLYCPREAFPLAGTVIAAVDTAIASLALVVMFVVTGFTPRATVYWLPLLAALQVVYTFAVVLLVSAVVVYVRDIRNGLPLLVQLGLFVTPIAYGLDAVPSRWRGLYSGLNPLGPIFDGYRRALLYGFAPNWRLLGIATGSTLVLLLVALKLFKRMEVGFADFL